MVKFLKYCCFEALNTAIVHVDLWPFGYTVILGNRIQMAISPSILV